MSNFFVQELVLYRHFMLIDSPIPFELVANPTNYRKDERGNVLNVDMSEITGRDICSRPAGAWRVDCWTLLPEKYHKQNPVFTMLIKYDKDLLKEGEIVDIRYSDIDVGEGVAGVNGQLVSIPADDFRPVGLAIETASAFLGDKIDESHEYFSEISADVDSLEAIMSDFHYFIPHDFCSNLNEFRDFVNGLPLRSSRLFLMDINLSISGGDIAFVRFHGLFIGYLYSRLNTKSILHLTPLFTKGAYGNSSYEEIFSGYINFDTVGVSSCGFATSSGMHTGSWNVTSVRSFVLG